MRLKYYITEQNDKTIQDIKKNCSQIIKEYEINPSFFLVRDDSKSMDHDFYLKTIRKDRTPKDTPQWLHEIFDNSFKKYFNKPLRSQSLFAVKDEVWLDDEFYESSIVFPFNGYKLIQSNIIDDLYKIYSSRSTYEKIMRKIKDKRIDNYVENNKIEFPYHRNPIKGIYEFIEYEKKDKIMMKEFKNLIQEIINKIVKSTYKKLSFENINGYNEIMIDCDKAYLVSLKMVEKILKEGNS